MGNLAARAWRQRLRPVLARSDRLRAVRRALIDRLDPHLTGSFWEVPPEQAVRMAYNVLLRREPDPEGAAQFLDALARGEIERVDVLDRMRWSDEFHRVPLRPGLFGYSLHQSRSEFIKSLPRARTILDLGGSSSRSDHGALVEMGYPYIFESLTIVDLPPEDRHDLYRYAGEPLEVQSPNGPVRYAYHSMTDLARYPDAGFDLVYSGQTIEHVSEEEADRVLAEVHRLLRPGGHLALDTPNARACRAQQPEFIDPDHKVEYTHQEMVTKLETAGFSVVEAKGLNYVGRSLSEGGFSAEEAASSPGVFATPEDCYLLAYVCRKEPAQRAEASSRS